MLTSSWWAVASARRDPRAYLSQPGVGLRGFFWQRIFRHVAIIGASGVGGGSTVWAGVLLEPRDGFYADPAWSHLHPDWRAELAPHLARAAGMLGRVITPHRGPMDDHLAAAAARLGAGVLGTLDLLFRCRTSRRCWAGASGPTARR
jgi:cholesterol oxidase